ncbi:hypothetical protein ACFV1B_05560 [Streptomyces sp. NPDC059637]|uniref:hypothetical protein n=1 Tax=Streptomyces sp. NPDC059637 TaxID=3347752 RepID=UPI00369D4670
MAHALKGRAGAVSGPRLAADIVAVVREGFRVRLDYSVGSLAVADRLIGAIRREAPPVEAVTETLVGFGAYLGEVLVREAGAVWVDFDEAQRQLFGQDFGVLAADGRVWNPLGGALRRYENGAGESLPLFHLAVVGRAQG